MYGVAFVRLGDVATISRGGSFQKKDFAEVGVPCIHYGQIHTHYGVHTSSTITRIDEQTAKTQRFAQPNDVVMAITSEDVEYVCKSVAWEGNEPVAVSGHTVIIHSQELGKYLSYYFGTESFFQQKKKRAHGTKVVEVNPSTLEDVVIPLPPLDEQRRIAAILDRFDSLCNDLTSGLPAEIDARKKQYEYYRDRLLAFPVK